MLVRPSWRHLCDKIEATSIGMHRYDGAEVFRCVGGGRVAAACAPRKAQVPHHHLKTRKRENGRKNARKKKHERIIEDD